MRFISLLLKGNNMLPFFGWDFHPAGGCSPSPKKSRLSSPHTLQNRRGLLMTSVRSSKGAPHPATVPPHSGAPAPRESDLGLQTSYSLGRRDSGGVGRNMLEEAWRGKHTGLIFALPLFLSCFHSKAGLPSLCRWCHSLQNPIYSPVNNLWLLSIWGRSQQDKN